MVCKNKQKLLFGHNYFSNITASLPDVFIKGVVCGGKESCYGICWQCGMVACVIVADMVILLVVLMLVVIGYVI